MLEGKTALITGAARRIGAATARGLHAEGVNLVVHYNRSSDAADALAAELSAVRPDSIVTVPADLLDVESHDRLVRCAIDTFGRLDILVNNASTFYPTPVGEITEESWTDLLGTNLKAPLFLAQAAAEALSKSGGVIVNLVDIHARQPLAGHPVYCAAKAGLDMLTRSLAKELGPDIRVNGVAPGPILWPEAEMEQSAKDAIVRRTALKRVGCPDDIVKTILFFVRDATYVTGQVLAVDGGRSLG